MSATSVAEQEQGEKDATKAAVRDVVTAYNEAFNSQDSDALAALFGPRSDYIGPRGQRIEGPEAIKKNFERFFSANQTTNLDTTVTAVRLVGDDVAMVDGIAKITPPLQGPPMEDRFIIVLRKDGDRWLVESVRDILISTPSNYEHLAELEWLIGDWVDAQAASDDVSVRSTCDWTVNKNFIIRKFTAELGDRISTAGTQLIGWDPRTSTIRSWVFDSDGGFVEARWQHEGNRWMIHASGVLQDGSEVAATNILTRIDENSFTFQSRNRAVNGRSEPDIEEITIQRESSEVGADAEPPRETVLPD